MRGTIVQSIRRLHFLKDNTFVLQYNALSRFDISVSARFRSENYPWAGQVGIAFQGGSGNGRSHQGEEFHALLKEHAGLPDQCNRVGFGRRAGQVYAD
jgi:hypothetical protein